ncbi:MULTISPECIES: hypothetical protein [Streptomyces]|uniref:Uncharacterized protein n=1 Tax=Streptomyces viridochromogenes TaxID=1938 RepID=A0A0L8KFS6_STRVR|nr:MULTISPECIES: hypothetical protein [Streptomyces]KOG24706.1 hypothetical protein ADK34_18685 [Streptomyces viridochromogenes]
MTLVGEGLTAALGPVIAVENDAGEAAAGPFGRMQGIDDEAGPIVFMTRAPRLWFTTSPFSRSSTVILGTP